MKLPTYAKKAKFINRGLSTFNQKKTLLKELKLTKIKKLKLLEIGCGQGILLAQLSSKFKKNLELHGLNLSPEHGVKTKKDYIKNAKLQGINLENRNLPEIHFGDATRLPFKDNSFDIIISQVTFLHIKNKAKAIEETYRVLKRDGLALISLSAYSIRIGSDEKIPLFYQKLDKLLKEDYNPKILIRNKNKKFISLQEFVNDLNKTYNIKLWTHKFVSETQRAKGFWLIIRKNDNQKLQLGLKYQKKESKEMTDKYANGNPVNFGVIDVYDLK
jgi:ubiquinone/menaquinone biosynthesis C-methylase UbiE